MMPARRRPRLTAPVLRAVALILFASLWAESGALHITTHYANRTCEQPLQDILTVSTSTYTTTSETMVGGALVQETQRVTITNNNVTETLMLWKYFSHDLVDVDPTSASTLHNDATATAMCSYSGSLTKLKKVLESIITDCGYEVLSSGAHIFQALYRIETECSVNSDGKHCVTPKDFFARPYHNSIAQVETEIPEAGTSMVTTVTTETDHPLTWGTADLMVQACPGSCPESGDKNRTGYCLDEDLNPPPSKGDCCMKVMWDYGIKHLGLGPEAECEMFRNLGNDCIVEPSISQEIDVAVGGEAKLRSGAGVTVPAGAISTDQCASPCAVSVEVAKPASSNLILAAVKKDNVLWTRVRIMTQILDFGPDGLKFSTPVTACLKAAAAGITNVSSIKVYQFNLTDGSTIGTLIVPDSFDNASKLVCFKTSSFSSYGGLSYQELSENSLDAEQPANNNVQYILGAIFGSLGGIGCILLCWYVTQKRQQDELYESRAASRVSSRMASPSPIEVFPIGNNAYMTAEMPYPKGVSPLLGTSPLVYPSGYSNPSMLSNPMSMNGGMNGGMMQAYPQNFDMYRSAQETRL